MEIPKKFFKRPRSDIGDFLITRIYRHKTNSETYRSKTSITEVPNAFYSKIRKSPPRSFNVKMIRRQFLNGTSID